MCVLFPAAVFMLTDGRSTRRTRPQADLQSHGGFDAEGWEPSDGGTGEGVELEGGASGWKKMSASTSEGADVQSVQLQGEQPLVRTATAAAHIFSLTNQRSGTDHSSPRDKGSGNTFKPAASAVFT